MFVKQEPFTTSCSSFAPVLSVSQCLSVISGCSVSLECTDNLLGQSKEKKKSVKVV